MQHLLLAVSVLFLTVIARNGHGKEVARKDAVVMKMQKNKGKKTNATLPADRLSVYSSRFDMIVN